MKTIPFSHARAKFTEIADQVYFNGERCLFTKNNKPVVALINIAEVKLLDKLIELFEDQEDVRALKQMKHEKSRPIEDFWNEIDL